MSTLHGGVPSAPADSAMGLAYASTLGEGESFTTLDLTIHFLRPVSSGLLTADVVVVQRGQTMGLTERTIHRRARPTDCARGKHLYDPARR